MCFFDGRIREIVAVPEALLAPLDKLLETSRDTFLVENAHKPNKFGDFEKSTQHIVFKFPVSLNDHRRSIFTPVWEKYRDAVEPILDAVTPWYGFSHGQTCRIMLAKLGAGKEISRHVDGMPASDVPHKIHVPLITHPAVEFWVDEEIAHLPRGAAYEVNNKLMHGGANRSGIDRIHLIFDYYKTD